MQQETRLQGLLARYVEHHVEHGEALSARELCADVPELLGPLRHLIRDYHELDRSLALPSPLKEGEQVGPYRILSRLGSGGMGEVFRAEDLKLGRLAAIKVLRPEAVADRKRLSRFEQEARAASALNHPNIITIYDIDWHEGAPYIAMELVEGKTLTELMAEGPLRLSRALDYALQIALGLARAHSQGIVHRDLKPDNLMVTGEGLIKILDFGLAKLTERDLPVASSAAESAHPQTQEGHILGTAPYMSPEQATGRPVDHRSDIFSFGSVLYEMVTGQRPFAGDTSVQLMAAIVEQEPPNASELQPSIPPELDRLIHRALQKDPERRFQSTSDIKVELVEVKEELESANNVPAVRSGRAVHDQERRLWPWIALVLVVMGVGLGVRALRLVQASGRPEPESVQLTSLEGRETWPALSPDGKQVAYTWDGGVSGPCQLYVKLVEVGDALQLTHGSEHVSSPTWSPDGSRIGFLRGGSDHREIVIVPALGGSERILGVSRATKAGLAWSPDDDLLAVVDKLTTDGPDAIFLLSLEKGKQWQLTSPDSETFRIIGDRAPAFSPDGRTVGFVRQATYMGGSFLYAISIDGENERQLTFDGKEIADVEWGPKGRSLVFASERGGLRALWSISRRGGQPTRLVVGEKASGLSISRSGRRLVYSRWVTMTNLYRIPGPASESSAPPQRLIGSSGVDLDPLYSPDGDRIVFGTTRSGRPEVWTCDSDGDACRMLTTGFNPSWSPDSTFVVYSAKDEDGRWSVFVMHASGGLPRRLTEGPEHYLPTWSRDGQHVYFLARTENRGEIWRIPSAGGEALQITRGGGINAIESEDERYLFFATHAQTRQGQIWRMPLSGGEKELVVDWGPDYMNWDLWQNKVVYLDPDGEEGPAIAMVDPNSGKVTLIARVGAGSTSSRGISVSPDGQWVVYGHRDVGDSDLILVDNFRLD